MCSTIKQIVILTRPTFYVSRWSNQFRVSPNDTQKKLFYRVLRVTQKKMNEKNLTEEENQVPFWRRILRTMHITEWVDGQTNLGLERGVNVSVMGAGFGAGLGRVVLTDWHTLPQTVGDSQSLANIYPLAAAIAATALHGT